MRDQATQAQGLAGERIHHRGLIEFIARNYSHDEQGRWFFQNGPQRVYVNLSATPHIAHRTVDGELQLHTGEALGNIEQVYLTEDGQLAFQTVHHIAQLDDRDLSHYLPFMQINNAPANDDALLAWIEGGDAQLEFALGQKRWPIQRTTIAQLANQIPFIQIPTAEI